MVTTETEVLNERLVEFPNLFYLTTDWIGDVCGELMLESDECGLAGPDSVGWSEARRKKSTSSYAYL